MIAPDPAPAGPRPAAVPRTAPHTEPQRSADPAPRRREDGDFEAVLAGKARAGSEPGKKRPEPDDAARPETGTPPTGSEPVPGMAVPEATPVAAAPAAPVVAAAEAGAEAAETAPVAGMAAPVPRATAVETAPEVTAAEEAPTPATAERTRDASVAGVVPAPAITDPAVAPPAAGKDMAATSADVAAQPQVAAAKPLPEGAPRVVVEAVKPTGGDAGGDPAAPRAEPDPEARPPEPRNAAAAPVAAPPTAAAPSAAIDGPTPAVSFTHDAAPPAWHLTPDTGAAPVRGETVAAAAAALPPTVAPQAVVTQVAVAIGRASDRRVEIRLDPPELGRVQIHLTPLDGGLQAMVLSDRPETNDLLRRHAELLARELNAAGYDSVSLDFAAGGETPARDTPRNDWVRATAAMPEAAAAPEPAAPPRHAAAGGLDIRL